MLGRIALLVAVLMLQSPRAFGQEATPGKLLTGAAAFGDWRQDAPGVRRHIKATDLPPPFATQSAANSPRVVPAKPGVLPKVPPGFEVAPLVTGLEGPRLLRVAPNGDIFVAEMEANRIRVLRLGPNQKRVSEESTFTTDLSYPFGIAFYPPGPDPQWVYVGNTDSVVRFPYRNGDLKARGAPETVVKSLPTGGHATRDVVFSPDGRRMFVSVGSGSNVGKEMEPKSADAAAKWDAQQHAVGAGWGDEELRADVLEFTPEGKDRKIFATGIRNCVGLAVQPATSDIWCATNERDGLGDNLAPDYATRMREGGFYGWPWYYIGGHPDPAHHGKHPELRDTVLVPDVLLPSHTASLQIAFYTGTQFPAEYRGDIFSGQNGSWNRSIHSGYEVIRVLMEEGRATGVFEDFLTGFLTPAGDVWGKPVGVGVAADGSLLVSDDGSGSIWRVRHGT